MKKDKERKLVEKEKSDDNSNETWIPSPKYYGNACQEKALTDPNYSNFDESFEITYEEDNYWILKKIGKGKYSEVYSGKHKKTNQKVAIKILKPIEMRKVRREIKILQTV